MSEETRWQLIHENGQLLVQLGQARQQIAELQLEKLKREQQDAESADS